MKKLLFVTTIIWACMMLFSPVFSADVPIVTAVEIEGNVDVVAAHINAIVRTKVGDPLDEKMIEQDVANIYQLGFFQSVNVEAERFENGVKVIFVVVENPKVKSISFKGNTIYKEKDLAKLLFTTTGSIFNREFFKRDLDRVKEKYQKDGYVLVKIGDVQTDNEGNIVVTIIEPKVGDIIIQGNKKTKTFVVQRYLLLKPGDVFNSKRLRHSLNKLQQIGFFTDVSVGFEPTPEPDIVNIVLTVKEGRTGNVGVSIGHGTSSGWAGGLVYEESNFRGVGQSFKIGFELGDDEQYWIEWQEPWMDRKSISWKVGAFKRQWDKVKYTKDDYNAVYNEERVGGYIGFGKKMSDTISAYLNLEWRDIDIEVTDGELPQEYVDDHLLDGTTFSATARIVRDTLDPFLSYPKGDVESVEVERAFKALGGDWEFTKYTIETRYYVPVKFLENYIDFSFGTEDNPPLIALRARAGFSDGDLPWAEQFFVGGVKTLRGYDSGSFSGGEMFVGNAELRLPLQDAISLVIFYDVGNAWDKTAGEKFDFNDLYNSPGVGLRIRTPFGNLRVDVAEGDDETVTTFSFGELF